MAAVGCQRGDPLIPVPRGPVLELGARGRSQEYSVHPYVCKPNAVDRKALPALSAPRGAAAPPLPGPLQPLHPGAAVLEPLQPRPLGQTEPAQGSLRLAGAAPPRLLNGSESTELFAGPQGRRPRCVRCAVVGNGGILNGSRQGLNIDAHDFVFRLNGAVIRGFEQDVGTRTSFYGFTVNTLKNSLISYGPLGFTAVPQGQDLRYIFIPSDARDYLMLRSSLRGEPVPEGRDQGDRPQKYFGPEASAGKFKLLHPDFISYLTERFLKSKFIKTKFGDLYMPSTGALMLLTALHSCDQVSAYGFITSNYRKFSNHYFERVRKPLVFYVNHDLPLEAKLWESLHQARILWLYQR